MHFTSYTFCILSSYFYFSFACKPLFLGSLEQRRKQEKVNGEWDDFNISSFKKEVVQTCECGVRPEKLGRISGGEQTEKNEFPWQAALVYRNTRIPFCGGTLINSLYVLTAAHCVLNMPKILLATAYDVKTTPEEFLLDNDFQVLLNAHDLTPFDNKSSVKLYRRLVLDSWDLEHEDHEMDYEEGTMRFNVEKRIFHTEFVKEYRKLGFDYDIALLKLEKPVNLSGKNSPIPICLPETSEHEDYENATALTVGWGRTNFRDSTSGSPILQKLSIPIYSLEECFEISGIPVSNRFICAGHQTKAKDIGKSDSGGPLLIQNDGKWTQIGVVSWGAGEVDGHVASGFTRLTAFLTWILHHIGENSNSDLLWCSEGLGESNADNSSEILELGTPFL